jgi:hypothetical protein
MNTAEPFDVLDCVRDEASFLAFLSVLAADAAGLHGWENGTIQSYLSAAAAWAKDSPQTDQSRNPLRRCAEIMYAGKGYE